MRPVIWRIQEPPARMEVDRDYSSLKSLGAMVTVLAANECPSVYPEECEHKLRQSLERVSPGDYILWSGGDPMSAFLAGKVLGELAKGSIRWLRWDRKRDESGARIKQGYYVPVVV